MRIVSEAEFRVALKQLLRQTSEVCRVGSVTGPGRSGAVASVYASHILGVPFIPFGQMSDTHDLGRLLIIDTATDSGKTLRKAERKYQDYDPLVLAVYHEPPRVAFWYEARKPQRFKHEKRTLF